MAQLTKSSFLRNLNEAVHYYHRQRLVYPSKDHLVVAEEAARKHGLLMTNAFGHTMAVAISMIHIMLSVNENRGEKELTNTIKIMYHSEMAWEEYVQSHNSVSS